MQNRRVKRRFCVFNCKFHRFETHVSIERYNAGQGVSNGILTLEEVCFIACFNVSQRVFFAVVFRGFTGYSIEKNLSISSHDLSRYIPLALAVFSLKTRFSKLLFSVQRE